ncbi:MAG: divalent-cation tolerance protein CutA [Rickettsiaceae bacterium]|nr:divalent-cation tolerance protein CutA [Rickettsiaceae bacterium]
MKSRESCIVITTTDSEDIANKIAGKLVEQRLAACVQIDKVKSFFYYEEECRQEKEFRLIIKAASKNYKIIEESIKSNHNYRLPQIIKLDITDGLVEYMDWIHAS